MIKTGRLVQLTERALQTRDLISALTSEIADLKTNLLAKAYQQEAKRLTKENEKLQEEVQLWHSKLVQLEIQNGIAQIPLPNSTGSSRKETVKVEVKDLSPEKALESEQSFPNKKQKTKKSENEKSEKKNVKAEKPAPQDDNQAVDVSRLDMRIGRIIAVEKHKDAESLYVEQIELGEERPRTVVSGLVKHVPIEEMQDRLVVLLCNLKAAKMRGITSEAMVMCASTPEKVEILSPPVGSQPGDRVIFEGYPGEPDAVLNPKKKIFEQVAPDLKTNADCVASYKGVPFTVALKGVVKAATLANVQIK